MAHQNDTMWTCRCGETMLYWQRPDHWRKNNPRCQDWPDLTRTAAAIDTWDREYPALVDELVARPSSEARHILDQMQALDQSVAAAFADDTADRNDRTTALRSRLTSARPNPEDDCTLRKWVRQWRAWKEATDGR